MDTMTKIGATGYKADYSQPENCDSPAAYPTSRPARHPNDYHRAFHSVRTLVESIALPKVKHTEMERELDALLCACESATDLGRALDRTTDRAWKAEMAAKEMEAKLMRHMAKHQELVEAFLNPESDAEKFQALLTVYLGFNPKTMMVEPKLAPTPAAKRARPSRAKKSKPQPIMGGKTAGDAVVGGGNAAAGPGPLSGAGGLI